MNDSLGAECHRCKNAVMLFDFPLLLRKQFIVGFRLFMGFVDKKKKNIKYKVQTEQ